MSDTERALVERRLLGRKLRRAGRLGDRLRSARHYCGLELRACPPWHKTEATALEARMVRLTGRLDRLAALAAELEGKL